MPAAMNVTQTPKRGDTYDGLCQKPNHNKKAIYESQQVALEERIHVFHEECNCKYLI